MEINLLLFLILALASYRITRFFVIDSLFAHSRQKLYVALGNASDKGNRFKRFLAHKLLEGLSCTWCLGMWVTGGVYWVFVTYGLTWYLIVAGLAGLQGLVHAYEPGDDE